MHHPSISVLPSGLETVESFQIPADLIRNPHTSDQPLKQLAAGGRIKPEED